MSRLVGLADEADSKRRASRGIDLKVVRVLRRPMAAVASLSLLVLLAACGNEADNTAKDKTTDATTASPAASASESPTSDTATAAPAPTSGPIDNLSIGGTVGKSFDVKIEKELKADALQINVVKEGTGPKVAAGDMVLTYIWVGNGTSKEQVLNSYDNGKGEVLTVGEQLPPSLVQGMTGMPIGSRVAVLSPPADAFGDQGNPQLNIGATDSVVFVLDLDKVIAQEPAGKTLEPAKWAPKAVETDGSITGLDFAGTSTPKRENLLVTKLIKGDGPVVKSGQTIYVNYLGQVPGAEAPFDESFSTGTPVSFPIGVGQVIKGWDDGLVGQTVGSRVILGIPPSMGYPDGNPDAGIEKGDWLYFVVDILAAV